jgi:hypothetical protein
MLSGVSCQAEAILPRHTDIENYQVYLTFKHELPHGLSARGRAHYKSLFGEVFVEHIPYFGIIVDNQNGRWLRHIDILPKVFHSC